MSVISALMGARVCKLLMLRGGWFDAECLFISRLLWFGCVVDGWFMLSQLSGRVESLLSLLCPY